MKRGISFYKICLVIMMGTIYIQSCNEEQLAGNKINFRSGNLPVISTKSVFQPGNQCDIHIIHSGTRAFYTGGSPLGALCDIYGNILPVNPVFLEKGYYDFYLLSVNSSDSPGLIFNDGYSANLINGYDYLWSGMKGVTVSGDKTLSFNFKRLCCRIELNIVNSQSVKNMVVRKVEFALPNPAGSTLDLLSGSLSTTPGNGDLTVIPGDGYGRTITMLPKSGSTEVAVEIDGEINGIQVYSKRFRVLLNVDFLPGMYYVIDLEIESDLLADVKIQLNPWRITGNENVFNLIRK